MEFRDADGSHESSASVHVAADEHGHEEDHHGHRRAADEEHREHATVGSCDYSLHVYPTKDLKEKYESNKPLFYSLAIILFFGFTSFVFILYDCLVERRQEMVLTSTNKTGKSCNGFMRSG